MKSTFYRIFYFIFIIPVRLIFRIRVIGAKNEPKRKDGPYLVCCNHQSVVDPILVCAAMRRQQPHWMAKAELFRVPVMRHLVRWLGAYPISRGKNDVGAVKRTVEMLRSGISVGMFPQGTRCAGKLPRECPVKSGAAMIASHANATILPVHIKLKNYTWKFFRRVTVIVGKPIPFEDFHFDHEKSGEFARITGEIYDEICRLGEETK